MKKTFFAMLSAMLIFAVAGSGSMYAGGKLSPRPVKSDAAAVSKTTYEVKKTETASKEKKGNHMKHKHHHKNNPKSENK